EDNKKNEKWKVTSTAILVTSDMNDKLALSKACKNKYVVLTKDSFLFKSDCLFGEYIKGEHSKYRKVTYKELYRYFDNEKLLSYLTDKDSIYKKYFLSEVKFKLSDGTMDSCNIIIN